MNDLLLLVKLLTAMYQAKMLKDVNLLTELAEILEELPSPPPDVLTQNRALRDSIRAAIHWLLEQDDDDPLIKSLLSQRVAMFTRQEEALKDVIEMGLEDLPNEEFARKLIYRQISEIRLSTESEDFQKKFKQKIKDFFYKDHTELKREDWANLMDLIQEKVNSSFGERQSEVVTSVNTNDPSSFMGIIDMAKKENSKEGIIRSGLQALNLGLNPDGGFKRGKFYMVEALTNRGKSFIMAHFLYSVGKYNKPQLRDPAKIPTILFESAEDTMDLIIQRMYKLACSISLNSADDFQVADNKDIVTAIADCFREQGWYLVMNQIEAYKDNMTNMFARVRKLELQGHEIIFYGYDYLALQNIDKVPGETKSDKLQLVYRRVRSFTSARGICFVTPHQLSPAAKGLLKEMDDESEVYFIREVAGKSMTETSTKITNEVDCVLGIHIAKTSQKNYLTGGIGKMRGEGCLPEERFFIYDLDPVHGLKHDIDGKPMFRRSLQQKITDNGLENDVDYL